MSYWLWIIYNIIMCIITPSEYSISFLKTLLYQYWYNDTPIVSTHIADIHIYSTYILQWKFKIVSAGAGRQRPNKSIK